MSLRVTVISCRDLPIGDFVTSDPFVELSVKGVKDAVVPSQRTRWLSSTLNPVFNETFRFESVTPMATLHVDLYDKDTTGHDFLCSLQIPLKTFKIGHPVQQWYPLSTGAEFAGPKSGGEILLDIEGMHPREKRDEKAAKHRSREDERTCGNYTAFEKHLGDVFAPKLISQVCDIFIKNDSDGSNTISTAELLRLLQDLYRATGSQVPPDDALGGALKPLIEAYDYDGSGFLDIPEFCELLKQSDFAIALGARWRPGAGNGLEQSMRR